jgi:hypothetical protein
MCLYTRCRIMAVTFIIMGALSLLLAGESVAGQKIDEAEARKLAIEGLKVYVQRDVSAKEITLTRIEDQYDPDFYYFEATWTNPISSPHIAYLAVNPWTGDVWNAAICKKLASASITKMQKDIQRRFRLTNEGDATPRSRKPLCNNK